MNNMPILLTTCPSTRAWGAPAKDCLPKSGTLNGAPRRLADYTGRDPTPLSGVNAVRPIQLLWDDSELSVHLLNRMKRPLLTLFSQHSFDPTSFRATSGVDHKPNKSHLLIKNTLIQDRILFR